MVMTWKDVHKNHELWKGVALLKSDIQGLGENLTARTVKKSRISPDSMELGRLQALVDYIATFQMNPHPAITAKALDEVKLLVAGARDALHRQQEGLFIHDSDSATQHEELARAVRSWPVNDRDELQSLGRFTSGLSSEIRSLESLIYEQRETANATIAERFDALHQGFVERQRKFEGSLDRFSEKLEHLENDARSFESNIEIQKTRLDQALVEHKRSHSEMVSSQSDIFSDLLEDHRESGALSMERMAAYEEQSIKVLQAVGINATATDYSKYAETQGVAADKWRLGAVVTFGLAGAIFLVVTLATFFGWGPRLEWWETAVQRVGTPVGLAGIASFFAFESNQHRKQERQARNTELTLSALEPFISNLPSEQQSKIRYETARNLFTSRTRPEDKEKATEGSESMERS